MDSSSQSQRTCPSRLGSASPSPAASLLPVLRTRPLTPKKALTPKPARLPRSPPPSLLISTTVVSAIPTLLLESAFSDALPTLPLTLSRSGRAWHLDAVEWPACVSLRHYIIFLVTPSIVYSPSFVRYDKPPSLPYIAEKAAIAGGLVTVATMIYDVFIGPVRHKEPRLFLAVADVVVLVTALMLCVFYVTFECVLNGAAEFTALQTADFIWHGGTPLLFSSLRAHGTSPVHTFLRRHIYEPTKAKMGTTAANGREVCFLYCGSRGFVVGSDGQSLQNALARARVALPGAARTTHGIKGR